MGGGVERPKYWNWSGIIDGQCESMRYYRDSETMLTTYRKLQEQLAEKGAKPLFKDIPGFILGFLAETVHWDSGLRNNYFFQVLSCICFIMNNINHH